jgi:hypothetical protein
VFTGKKPGTTNAIVLDDTGTEIYNLIIEVGFGGTPQSVVLPPQSVVPPGIVIRIHNGKVPSTFTDYRCSLRCEFEKEYISKQENLAR